MTMTKSAQKRVEDLQGAVESALWQYDPLRPDLNLLKIEVEPDGVVRLSGPVRTALIRQGVIKVAERLRGVERVEDNLVDDHSLEVKAAEVVANHETTRTIPADRLQFHSQLGKVTVVGSGLTRDQRDRVLQTLQDQPEVREVVDRIETSES